MVVLQIHLRLTKNYYTLFPYLQDLEHFLRCRCWRLPREPISRATPLLVTISVIVMSFLFLQ
ncbi:hypothetical protein M758_UG187000 [Ceratodon purpureus]|nr:hypothetical protein M758_UG187000 [Ceratodon purpureus]